MWLILIIIFLTLLLVGSLVENGNLRGKLEARDYEKKVLENRLKQLEK